MAEAIQAEHLAYAYPGAEGGPGISVFRDLNLKIEEGTFVAVLGRNGCGKSTLAKHCNAIALPAGGTVTVFGMDTQDEGNLIPIRRTVGMVFQNPDNQIVANVVEEDVAFAPENLGVPEEHLEKSPFDLSGGQKRRVAIAGVIAMEPDVLILDEPTAGLDPQGRDSILENIRAYQKAKNATVMMVSHAMEEVARVTDRLLVMDHGGLRMDNSPREVFRHAWELQQIGLAIPQVTRVFLRLRELGVPVDSSVYTVEQAARELLRLKGGKGSC